MRIWETIGAGAVAAAATTNVMADPARQINVPLEELVPKTCALTYTQNHTYLFDLESRDKRGGAECTWPLSATSSLTLGAHALTSDASRTLFDYRLKATHHGQTVAEAGASAGIYGQLKEQSAYVDYAVNEDSYGYSLGIELGEMRGTIDARAEAYLRTYDSHFNIAGHDIHIPGKEWKAVFSDPYEGRTITAEIRQRFAATTTVHPHIHLVGGQYATLGTRTVEAGLNGSVIWTSRPADDIRLSLKPYETNPASITPKGVSVEAGVQVGYLAYEASWQMLRRQGEKLANRYNRVADRIDDVAPKYAPERISGDQALNALGFHSPEGLRLDAKLAFSAAIGPGQASVTALFPINDKFHKGPMWTLQWRQPF